MKFTKIPANTFEKLQLNAGVLLSEFNPAEGTVTEGNILGATSGGVNFAATPTYTDYGEDIDNCPKNTKELKRLDEWAATMSGTYLTVDTERAKRLLAAADVSGNKITPRNDLKPADFADIWWVGDYSSTSGDAFVAIRLINALSTGGFQIQSGDKAKGQFAFEYTAHYSMSAPDTVPFEIYIGTGA